MPVFYERGKKYNCIRGGKPYFRKSVYINGKCHQVFGDGEKDADHKIAELKALADKGVDLTKRHSKTGDLLKFWLYSIKRVDSSVKDSSFARYECSYRNQMIGKDIMQVPISKLNKAKMQQYITSLYEDYDVRQPSIKATLKVWRMFTKWAIDEEYLVKDPCRNIVLPGEYSNKEKIIETFTAEERAKILKYMEETNYQYAALIKLAFATGMRRGELLGLRWDDCDQETIHVRNALSLVTHIDKDGNRCNSMEVWDPKTKNAHRDIPLLPATRDMLRKHRLEQNKYYLKHGLGKPVYCFTTGNGKLIEGSSFARSYARMLKRAGVPYRKFHAIRHTFATEAIRRGVNVKDLQMLMGHADIETTYVYVHANAQSQQQAIELMGAIM